MYLSHALQVELTFHEIDWWIVKLIIIVERNEDTRIDHSTQEMDKYFVHLMRN